jgi:hypothetical protein
MNKKIVVVVDETIHRKFKFLCVAKGKDMSEVVREKITEWMDEQIALQRRGGSNVG